MKQTYKEIEIISKRVVGVANPKLCFLYRSNNPNPSFKLYLDGKQWNYNILKQGNTGEYLIESPFSKTVKEVKLVYVEDKKEYVLWKFHNYTMIRLLSKLEGIPHKVCLRVKMFFMVLKHFVSLFWEEYHFIIPRELWGKYWEDFKISMKATGKTLYFDPNIASDYSKWLKKMDSSMEYETLDYQPLISILIPVYNISSELLSQCIESILNQSYKNFEICLADDHSTKKETISTLKKYENLDARIKVVYREKNGHISAASNSALSIANGEFIALMDNDDTLDKDALYENVLALNRNRELDFIYSDEDKIDIYGRRCFPNFKPDFSPDTLLSMNYICHFVVIRKSLVDQVGGFELGLEGAQDYDLFLKISEKTKNIHHIPRILYHWRMIPGSTAESMDNKDYASDKGKIAIENALRRRNIKGYVNVDPKSLYYRVVYDYDEVPISIIIPTRDYADVTERCLASIYEKTTYQNFEILMVNNRSEKQETFDLFRKYQKEYKNFKVIDADMEFNYSKINNLAVEQAKGEVIVLLNNDTEVLSPDWLTQLVGYALQDHIGTVGAKLLYPDMTVQHAGIIMGLGGVASHAYIGSSREDIGVFGRLRVPFNYSGVTAACLAIKKSLFDELGQLETDLTVAYNDVDLNLKALQAGYYNVMLPQVELIHYESKSRGLDTSSEKYKRFLSEEEYMYNKWGNMLKNDPYYNPNYSKKMWFLLDK